MKLSTAVYVGGSQLRRAVREGGYLLGLASFFVLGTFFLLVWMGLQWTSVAFARRVHRWTATFDQ